MRAVRLPISRASRLSSNKLRSNARNAARPKTEVAEKTEETMIDTFDALASSMRLSRRAVLRSGAGALAAAALTGSSRHAFAAAKPASLNMLYATSEADSDAIKAAVPDFKTSIGIDINVDTMPYNALQQKVFAELASGSSYYDIMIVDTPWMPALTNKIDPITDIVLDPALSADL